MSPLLTVRGLSRSFGGVAAVQSVDLEVEQGTIRAVIGPNGAGKTTLLDLVTGFTKPDMGTVDFDGHQLVGRSPRDLPSLGLMRTFQSARLVPSLTVRENVMLGAYRFTRARFLSDALRLPRTRREERELRSRADELIGFLDLTRFADSRATDLPAGAQRLVEVARGLAGAPKLLLLDEPAAGLDDSETRELADVLHAVREGGVTMVLIEHNMSLVLAISDQVTVMDAGKVIADDVPSTVREDAAVRKAYLGVAS
ncbi:branched-chain amino acid transport system ATP-binding protein [Nocardioides luteus]|uniref:ABC transporter ATP-binding protein n=1 Tax=Nocardioides luteus TaxID=1844 RepID=A0ABQ5SZ03_9ACTN|nr:ABC transporter ATP-binding protein [Nocardioides luteus]MDR7312587.1 branched-chain amino acid transport system ATP-binding protein [Nocardioides luteus]GGR46088.1 ABC transporter ATP-binding protein [Nocardioides luteus]GLJ68835.1 ABC transporter ATP-binding protein [Nocardioides luteus]